MDQKLCKKCDIQKDLIFFNKDKSKNDGYRNSCKECQKNFVNRVIKRDRIIYG